MTGSEDLWAGGLGRAYRLMAADFAEQALHIFEALVPTDPRPRQAIVTARCLASGTLSTSDEERHFARFATMSRARNLPLAQKASVMSAFYSLDENPLWAAHLTSSKALEAIVWGSIEKDRHLSVARVHLDAKAKQQSIADKYLGPFGSIWNPVGSEGVKPGVTPEIDNTPPEEERGDLDTALSAFDQLSAWGDRPQWRTGEDF